MSRPERNVTTVNTFWATAHTDDGQSWHNWWATRSPDSFSALRMARPRRKKKRRTCQVGTMLQLVQPSISTEFTFVCDTTYGNDKPETKSSEERRKKTRRKQRYSLSENFEMLVRQLFVRQLTKNQARERESAGMMIRFRERSGSADSVQTTCFSSFLFHGPRLLIIERN